MSLPPGFMDELRSRTSLAQVVGRKVMWDQRKSNQGKGDMWAPCPFHQEKSASFHVDDRKGFYYCFGCHAKGDLFSFVQETENVGFMEAVEILAREAGMQMPARDPKAQEKTDHRAKLAEVMEQAVQFFRLQLKTGGAAAAREYLAGRGLSGAALDRWEIGFAPDGWQGLWDHLTGKGVAEELILGAGLAKPSNQGKRPYDTFRNRIMFPIRDVRGRCIAFGGRAMDPNDNAKYLNSPETDLFDKGRSLYNHGPAREAAGKGQPLIVAEGYMDVIALSEAGLAASVAPLGTAVTEDQVRLLWRMHDEPVIALDGDKAGLRAALRVIDIALPMLEAGKSLRFCLMPEGLDPDDLIRAEGAGAMRKLVEGAVPMVRLLWQRETEGRVFDSPERRAALDLSLREAVRKIADPSIRRHYGDELNRLRRALFDQGGPGRARGMGRPFAMGRGGRFAGPATPMVETKASALAAEGAAFEDRLREAVILATLLRHRSLLPEFVADLERLDTTDPDHAAVQGALLYLAGDGSLEIETLCPPHALEKVHAPAHVRIAPGVQPHATEDVARMSLAEEFAKLTARRGAEREIAEAIEDVEGLVDEGLTWRLGQAAEARAAAERSGQEDRAEYDTGPNGARIRREEKSAFSALLDRIDFAKSGRREP
ncbi:DNA primase [Alphaproteobacteria bacterium GH1-50]|uniref:DNA primase n=1 Tax=Kangsaoukella pontilimi TaxID=2691042 RepID=A0A7C9IGC8_9RHOB|nr:DNA primase [Kangsaoukella pontilimi]MXQ07989.1 DNA primase [Kangsaoukella pontilimi]